MGNVAELSIDVVGDGEDADDGRQLLEWIRSDPELAEVVVMRASSPKPGEFGSPVATLVATLHSGSVITALVGVISAFLRQRRGVRIRITNTEGRTLELQGGFTASDIKRLVHAVSISDVGNFDSGSSVVVVPDGAAIGTATFNEPFVVLDDTSWRPMSERAKSSMLPVTIYLSNEGIHEQVEAAVEQLLTDAGLRIESRDDPILESWFRRMYVTVKEKLRTPAGREAVLVAAHAAETRLVLAPDADVTAKLLQGVGPVIKSLESTEDAVVRLGNVLIVKVDGVVAVSQLTPAQQFLLNHRPDLACSPQKILAALNDTSIEGEAYPPALQ